MRVRDADVATLALEVARPVPDADVVSNKLCLISKARNILNVTAAGGVDLRAVFANDIASRRQTRKGARIALSSVLAEADLSISLLEIMRRTGRHHRDLEADLAEFAAVARPIGWDRKALEHLSLLRPGHG